MTCHMILSVTQACASFLSWGLFIYFIQRSSFSSATASAHPPDSLHTTSWKLLRGVFWKESLEPLNNSATLRSTQFRTTLEDGSQGRNNTADAAFCSQTTRWLWSC